MRHVTGGSLAMCSPAQLVRLIGSGLDGNSIKAGELSVCWTRLSQLQLVPCSQQLLQPNATNDSIRTFEAIGMTQGADGDSRIITIAHQQPAAAGGNEEAAAAAAPPAAVRQTSARWEASQEHYWLQSSSSGRGPATNQQEQQQPGSPAHSDADGAPGSPSLRQPLLPACDRTRSAPGLAAALGRSFQRSFSGAGGSRAARCTSSSTPGVAAAAARSAAAQRAWQAAAHRVMAIRAATSTYRPGALQGLDVRRHNYDAAFGVLRTQVDVTVCDFCNEQTRVVPGICNDSLATFLAEPRPAWSKVRWINVKGLSWDVIQLLAVHFDLHPLSVEDIVHIPQRIKAEYYPEYLYASVLLLAVGHPSELQEEEDEQLQQQAGPPNGDGQAGSSILRRRLSSSGGSRSGAGASARRGGSFKRRQAPPAHLQPMDLSVDQASLFLFKDGTLLTIFSSQGEAISRNILNKLKGFRSLLTDSEDASYLFNAVLDGVVDHAMPVVNVYARSIAALEAAVLLDERPAASLTKELHLLSNDLKLLRRTLVPTQHLVHKLQSSHSDRENGQSFLSPLTLLYLRDVLDHISTIVEDMESLSEDAKDLIELIFNTLTHNSNASMQMLAVVSVVFLPITFIAGVYAGTNFDKFFPEIHWQWGYPYFWGVCCCVTVLFMMLLKRWNMFAS